LFLKHNGEDSVSQVGFIRSYQSSIAIIQRLSDALLLVGTLWLSVWLSGNQWSSREEIAALMAVLMFYFIAEINGLYASWRGSNSSLELNSLVWTWFWVVVILLLVGFVTKVSTTYSRQTMLTWFVLAPIGIGLWRSWVRVLLKNLRLFGFNSRRVVIAGAGDLGKRLAETIRSDSGMGLSLIGFYDDKEMVSLGNFDKLIADAKNGKMDCVYITLPMRAEKRIKTLLSELADTAVTVYIVPDLFVFELLHSRWQNMNGLPVISIYDSPLRGLGGFLKRLEDIVLSLLILIIITIPMLFISLGVKLSSPGPILFKQRRYGLGGENIWVWKFRTLKVCEDDKSFKQVTSNDPRITKFGNFLRRTSLDELPQFFNVLQGQMSVVGPRPHAILHNEQYRKLIPKYMLRHIVKPGITGWAQINGFRGETDTLEKMETRITYDLYYIEHWSLWLDIRIVFITIFKGFFN
jgi:putative colanic acid biosynthesis UDP-glucose lipid carrier transferase